MTNAGSSGAVGAAWNGDGDHATSGPHATSDLSGVAGGVNRTGFPGGGSVWTTGLHLVGACLTAPPAKAAPEAELWDRWLPQSSGRAVHSRDP